MANWEASVVTMKGRVVSGRRRTGAEVIAVLSAEKAVSQEGSQVKGTVFLVRLVSGSAMEEKDLTTCGSNQRDPGNERYGSRYGAPASS